MWENILGSALETGLIAALFVGLLIYILKDTKKREQKYQEMIKQLQDSLSIIADIQRQAEAISHSLVCLNRELSAIKHKILRPQPAKERSA